MKVVIFQPRTLLHKGCRAQGAEEEEPASTPRQQRRGGRGEGAGMGKGAGKVVPLGVGEEAPDTFTVTDAETGEAVTLRDLLGWGRHQEAIYVFE